MATLSVRAHLRAASGRLRRLERFDHLARAVITLGGLGVVASVVGILVFVAVEAWPLLGEPRGALAAELQLVPPPGVSPDVLVTGIDEYQTYVQQLRADGRLLLFRASDGAFTRELPMPAALAGVTLASASRSPRGNLALGTTDGRVALLEMQVKPVFEGQRRTDLEVALVEQATAVVDPAGRPVRRVEAREGEGTRTVAAWMGGDEIVVWRAGELGEPTVSTLHAGGQAVRSLALGGVDQLVAGTERGNVLHWDLGVEPPRLTSVSPVGPKAVSALTFLVGDTTFVAGDEAGRLSAWFPARLHEDDDDLSMVRAHVFNDQGSAVTAIAPSTRDKSFAAVGADGSLTLHYLTNERELLRFPARGEASTVLLTPRNDGVVVASPTGGMRRYAISVPHPEASLGALFGKSWYEGYAGPEYVWQSTGATNDFEPKLSLVPLIFGTFKATFYALLFAVPLSLLAALYTSQFVHPEVRARIKPVLEIMAALPSVVIGFVAGLWLASIVERFLAPVLLSFVLAPVFGTSGVVLWHRLPALARRMKPGTELLLIVPLLLLAGFVALKLGPFVEASLFGNDLKLWLSTHAGITYDQRNSLVVGVAMGFAVIPIIFTIADDAFTSVPSSLTAGSLALGASRWQTAVRVVLPTASAGLFSAVMVGFGRAVGETMIVLMATGNTPVMDWSIFNGMRTLSANIAVEIPEAPHGDTLYRTLFLSAGLLFVITFVVNTAAEVVRQRLRERYRTL